MNISELLRQLADMVDAHQRDATDAKVDTGPDYESETGTRETGEQPDDLFIPPLQLKMELLKKAVGVDNIYDGDESSEDGEQHSYDELEAIKRNAGIADINPVVMAELGDDEPLES